MGLQLKETELDQMVAHMAASIIQQHWHQHRRACTTSDAVSMATGTSRGSCRLEQVDSSKAGNTTGKPQPNTTPQQDLAPQMAGQHDRVEADVEQLMVRPRSDSTRGGIPKTNQEVVSHAEELLHAAGRAVASCERKSNDGVLLQSSPSLCIFG